MESHQSKPMERNAKVKNSYPKEWEEGQKKDQQTIFQAAWGHTCGIRPRACLPFSTAGLDTIKIEREEEAIWVETTE